MWPKFDCFWSAIRRRIKFFTCCGIASWTKIQSNLRGKQTFLIFDDCHYMLQNVDEITCLPCPVNWVFIQSLTNIEVAFFFLTTIYLSNNWIASLKVLLTLFLNSIVTCCAGISKSYIEMMAIFTCSVPFHNMLGNILYNKLLLLQINDLHNLTFIPQNVNYLINWDPATYEFTE